MFLLRISSGNINSSGVVTSQYPQTFCVYCDSCYGKIVLLTACFKLLFNSCDQNPWKITGRSSVLEKKF